ncbi:hypothetical protein C8R45DRAFT_837026, partial [Mycena sanguinolenta]
QEFQLPTKTIRSAFASNPLDSTSHDATPPPSTETVPARDVFHNVQAAMRPLIAGIQTREQVTDLIQSLQDLHQRNVNEARSEQIFDPPAISHKGRPRTARITNAREGRQQGGGARGTRVERLVQSNQADGSAPNASRAGRTYKCSLCRQTGHNRSKCPLMA